MMYSCNVAMWLVLQQSLSGCYIGVLLFCQNKIIAICVGYRIVDGELLNAMFVCLYYVLTISASQNVFFIKTVDKLFMVFVL